VISRITEQFSFEKEFEQKDFISLLFYMGMVSIQGNILTNMKLGGLYLLEPDGETLRLEVEHQISGSYLGARLKLGQGAAGQAAQNGEPLVVNDYRTWEHRVPVFGEQEFRRIIAVPLKARGKVIGVINLGDDQVQAPVTAEEMRLLRLFADQAAIVLEKVRLLEAERAKAQELQRSNQLIAALGLVAGRLQANLDADQLMSALGAELLQMGIYLLIAHHQTEQGLMSVRYTSIDTLALAEAEKMLQRTIRGLHSGDPIDHSVDRMGDRRPSFTQNLLSMFDPVLGGVPQDQVRQALRLIDIQENSAAISLPLVVKDRAFGSLVVWGKALRESDIPAFNVFSNHVAAALENARLYNEIQKLAIMDELTGLYNRRGFFALAQQNLQLAQRVKKGVLLIFADIDGMKEINDTLGHQTGDQALVDAAGILRVTYRSADIIARVGGDEFAILAVLSTRPDEAALSERLAENLEAFNAANDRPYVLSLSTGMSAWPAGKALELDKLLAEADVRMYANKRAKKGTG
ncbi:MAG: diguanylate cyclase, partial [Anaerolineae bacterium]|nr:diguanylate cyclase [Anaerolineae bacterium]